MYSIQTKDNNKWCDLANLTNVYNSDNIHYYTWVSNIFGKLFTPYGGAKYRWGIKFRDFQPITRYISQTIRDSAIVTMEHWQELVGDLSNGAIFNYLERTLTLFSRSHHSLTLNISLRVGNCTQAFEWHQFQWPWVTSKTDFKVTGKQAYRCPRRIYARSVCDS